MPIPMMEWMDTTSMLDNRPVSCTFEMLGNRRRPVSCTFEMTDNSVELSMSYSSDRWQPSCMLGKCRSDKFDRWCKLV
jgi:hypothetical protein